MSQNRTTSQSAVVDRLRAVVGDSRLLALLAVYDEPRGAVLPLVVILREAGIDTAPDVLSWIAQTCQTSPAIVQGAISAFPELNRHQDTVTVCDGLTCRAMGAGTVQRLLRERLGEDRVCTSSCQNACSTAPVLQIRGALYGALKEEALVALAQRFQMPSEAE